jgi:hypothetical protein
MKMVQSKLTVALLLASCISSVVSCYPSGPSYHSAYQSSKGDAVPLGSDPQPRSRYVVDPGLAVAGIAAAGVLGYAIGTNRSHHHHHYDHGPHHVRPYPHGPGHHHRPRYHR